MNIDWRGNRGWRKIHILDYLTTNWTYMKCGRKYSTTRRAYLRSPEFNPHDCVCPDCERFALLLELGE